MAVQSGVWFFDGRPVERERQALACHLRALAPDGVSTFVEDGLAMAFAADGIWTHEASSQPIRTDAGLIMTWDGRLDNRDDLLMRFSGGLQRDASDAEIALAVFERLGCAGLRDLIGDWSLVVWNSRARTLHLARDYMGVRPLYYYADHAVVMWSTSLGELAVRSGRVDDLDAAFVARFMSLQFSSDVTPYRCVRGVPTGTSITFAQRDGEQRHRFWRLEPGSVRYRRKSDYEEHLRTAWADAVCSRLRTQGRVWAELSGGLDSSAVVCMADVLIKSGRASATRVQPVSYFTVDSSEGDERRFVAAVEAHTGIAAEILAVEAHALETDDEWAWVSPLAPSGVKAHAMRRAWRSGSRVVLSGRMGDVTMGCLPDNSTAVFDDLAEWRVATALANMRRWSLAERKPFVEILAGLIGEVARPAAVMTMVDSTRQMTSRVVAASVRSVDAHERVCDVNVKALSRAQREQARLTLFYARQARLESWAERGSVAFAHPFAHRPLVDYMMSIPAEELSAPGVTRSLMRRAFAGLLPERVLRRMSKGYYPPAAVREARRRISALPPVDCMESVQRGWIDAPALRAAVARLQTGQIDSSSDVHLVLRLEHWLASRHRRGPAVIPTGKEVTTNDVRIA